MTTRRRRAGSSESYEESQDPAIATQQTVQPNPTIAINPLCQEKEDKNWSNLKNPRTHEAYYKKTDTRPGLPLSYPVKVAPAPAPQVYDPTQYRPPQNNNNNNSHKYNSFSQSVTSFFQPTPLEPQRSNPINQYDPISSIPAEEFETTEMACRDRTKEFGGIIRSQQHAHLSNGAAGAKGKSASTRDITQYSQFMKRARFVGRNISSTYAKLEKVTLLARKRSLFDDSQDVEVQELTGIIRHDLNSLTKQLEELSRTSSTQSPSNTSHMQKHSANLVGSLQTKVASITHKFRDVLEVRTENLKKQAERREQFTGSTGGGAAGGPVMSNGGLSGAPPPHTASVLLADEAKATAIARRGIPRNESQDTVLNFDGSQSGGAGAVVPVGGGAYQHQLQLMEEQDSLLTARAETMKTIETTIVELGTMFTHLASMVKEQDELVHRIDANVDDAEMNVEAAHTELLKYFRSVSSNRWLMFKVFGVVIIFFIIFIVFMA